jgi:hypothetical protein
LSVISVINASYRMLAMDEDVFPHRHKLPRPEILASTVGCGNVTAGVTAGEPVLLYRPIESCEKGRGRSAAGSAVATAVSSIAALPP